jgi:RNA polymerase II-associated factor 1
VPTYDGEDSWVAYYAPSLTTIEKIKIKRNAEALGQEIEFQDGVMEHVLQRDLDFKLTSSVYPYFLELRKEEGGAFYNPIQHHMKLKKRRILVFSVH